VDEKPYKLEDRTMEFFRSTIRLCKMLPLNVVNTEIVRQLIRSVGSVGANYREANEAISKKDLAFRIKISRKEARRAIFGSALFSRQILIMPIRLRRSHRKHSN